jgi:hypothetical protein
LQKLLRTGVTNGNDVARRMHKMGLSKIAYPTMPGALGTGHTREGPGVMVADLAGGNNTEG